MVPTKTTVNTGDQSWWREGLTSDDFDHEQVLPEITQKTVGFIEENAAGDQPFFVYMPLTRAAYTYPTYRTVSGKKRTGKSVWRFCDNG